MKRLAPYLQHLKPVIPQLVVALLAGLIFGAMGGLLPVLIKFMLPKIFDGNERQAIPTATLALYCSLPAVLMLIRGVAGFTNTYLLGFCSVHLTVRLQQQVFDRLQRLSLASIRKFKDGDLLTRINGDVNVVRIALVELVQELVKQPATLISAVAAIVWLCLQKREIAILLMVLALLPACIIPIRIIGRNMKRRALSMQGQVGELFNHVAQNLRASREVRAYSMEESESARFSEHLQIFRRFFMKIAKYNIILSPIIEIISAIGVGGALFYAYRGSIGAEDLAALLTAIYLCYEPVKRLGTLHNKLEQAMASLDRVEEVLHEPLTIRDPENPTPVSRLAGRIEFRNLTFAYAETPVLQDISVQLDAGRTYALVGPSGAGKSTFANLIPRFYDTVSGAVLIDGIDIRQMRLRDLRRNIAIVAQEPVLFDDTIYNNILIGNPQATREQVLDAARRAYAHDFINELESGYETQAGQAGSRLSGGQRQRIALARAFLKDAPILILDEATSALDAMSEQYIQQALAELMRGRTVIIIAHRFSSIQHADRILVFEQGRIVETGNHNELLDRSGLYANLYRTQSGGLVRD